MSAGQPTSGGLVQRLRDVFPEAQFAVGYGCTENVNRICLTWVNSWPGVQAEDEFPVGRPVPGVRVRLDKDSQVILSGESLMRGYLHELGDGSERIAEYETGDIGKVDDSGNLRLVGRLKTLMNVGNEMVSPEEVEAIVRNVRGVVDCGVGSYPDPLLGDAVGALVQSDGTADPAEVVRRVDAYVRTELSRAKRPKVLAVDTDPGVLPRTEYGKVDRRRLADELASRAKGQDGLRDS